MPQLLLALLFALLSWQPAPGAPANAAVTPPQPPPRLQGEGERGPADAKTLSPYFFVQGGDPSLDKLPLKATSATADIVGTIARVKVVQVYRNEGSRAIEAVYVFPASTRAAVHGMKMTIGERVITARIEERQEARRQYQQALQSGQSASLLEQQRPNVFQMSVANIMPGDEIRVDLVYSELLVPDRGVYEFVYPTVVGPRYSTTDAASAPDSERWVENPYLPSGTPAATRFGFEASISAGMPLKRVTSPSHRLDIGYPSTTRATLALPEDDAAAGNRDIVVRYQLAEERIETGLLLYESGGEKFFLCMVEPPQRFAPAQVPPREYVFVLDVSGSMHGFPLETTKAVLRNLLGRLRPSDSFNVLFFSGGSYVMSPSSLPANEANKAWALREIERQQGGGGTELLPALRRAFDLPRARHDVARAVVIATDGFVNVEREAFALVRDGLGDASIFAFGIGSSVNRHLIEGLARAGEGLPFVVLAPGEAQRAASRFLEYIESPLLTHVEVRTPGFQAYDLEPGRLPDLFAARPVVLAGKYRGEPAGEIVVTGFTGEGPFERRTRVDRGRVLRDGEALKYLWARERLSALADAATGSGIDAETKQEITRLGLEYGLLTEFTSFVAVDQVRRGDGRLETVKQPLPLPQGVSDLAVGGARASQKTMVIPVEAFAPGMATADAIRGGRTGHSLEPLPAPPRQPMPVLRVRVIENRASGSAFSVNAFSEAVRRALSGNRCSPAAGTLRVRVTFGAGGAVVRAEAPQAGANDRCVAAVLRTLRTLQAPGAVGGWVVVEVGWR